MSSNRQQSPEPYWLNKSQMAASLGISVQAFDKWGVKPVAKIGRSVYFDCRSVLDLKLAELEAKQQSSQPGDDDMGFDPLLKHKREQEEYLLTKERRIGQQQCCPRERYGYLSGRRQPPGALRQPDMANRPRQWESSLCGGTAQDPYG